MSQTDNNQTLLSEYGKYMLPVLNFRDIVLVRGQGSYVWDADGNRYLDLNSGQFCAVLGHSDPQQIHVEIPQEGFLRQAAAPQAWRLKDHAVPTVSLDLGVHAHHLVHFLTGGKAPLEVIGDQATYGQFSDIVDNVYCLAHYEDDLRVQSWFGKTALGNRNGLRIRVYGSLASAEWFQMQPEDLLLNQADGRRSLIDRGADDAGLARQVRYNRFKSGHPSGFIEAFANLYTDIADQLRQHQSGITPRNDFVYGAQESEEGLRFLEAISRSARTRKWETV